jgi:uncharacterized protein YicC (UPF0701 family)
VFRLLCITCSLIIHQRESFLAVEAAVPEAAAVMATATLMTVVEAMAAATTMALAARATTTAATAEAAAEAAATVLAATTTALEALTAMRQTEATAAGTADAIADVTVDVTTVGVAEAATTIVHLLLPVLVVTTVHLLHARRTAEEAEAARTRVITTAHIARLLLTQPSRTQALLS